MISLRPYQQRALDKLLDWFRANEGHPILDAAVGSGKSVMLGWLCQHAITNWPETRIIMLVPTKELLEQNFGKLVSIWPDAPVGIMSASVGKKQLGQAITIATIGSIYKHAAKLGHVDLLIVDECHAIPGGDEGMYRKFISEMHKYCPSMRVIGATGTPFRGSGIWLTALEDRIFTDIAARVTMDELLEEGFLAPLTTQATDTRMDASDVRTVGGDYVVSDLARAIDRPELVSAACAEAVRLASDRNKWLVYCVTVEHAHHVCSELVEVHGIAAEVITGETPKSERADAIEAFRRGDLECLVSVAVLTTGFDVPDVDCLILLRNTQSPVLYVQIMGRGMRTAPGKDDCLVLDFTDTIERLGPVNLVSGRLPKKNKGESPFKICESCGASNAISAKSCKECGAAFEVAETDPHTAHASNATVLAPKVSINDYEVTRVGYAIHKKEGKPDSLRVDYYSGILRVASEWVCFEHGGYARAKAEAWWQKRSRDACPSTSESAVDIADGIIGVVEPSAIRVNESGKFPEIVGFMWKQIKEAA